MHVRSHTCKNCGSLLNRADSKFCTVQCSSAYQRQQYINQWLKTGRLPGSQLNMPREYIRSYILEEQKGNCCICGMPSTWQNKHLTFVLDHIDGNAANNKRSNLRLVCPNCNSQLDTFCYKNRHSARVDRRYSSVGRASDL